MTDEENIVNLEPPEKLSTGFFAPPPMRSESVAKLAEAVAKAQATIRNPAKASENPHYRSRYADLASGLDAVRPALSEQGVMLSQTVDFEGDLLVLTTRLIHASGEWIGSRWPVGNFTKVTAQQMGSLMTYARRYSLFPLVGIAGADEDDDGEVANTAPLIQSGRRIDDDQFAELQSLINDARLNAKQFSDLGSIRDYTVSRYEETKARLIARIANIKERQS